jgi:ubiquinol-cytochrome c reductase cytochrome b subunit
VPVRTGLGVMALTFYILLWLGGGNDLIATTFGVSINTITRSIQVLLFVLPPIMFVITKRICLSLQRRDRDRLLHGEESGVIKRLPHGEFIEVHTPVAAEDQAVLMASRATDYQVREAGPAVDANGVKARGRIGAKIDEKLSKFYFADRVPPATDEELAEAASHHDHDDYPELTAGTAAEGSRHNEVESH